MTTLSTNPMPISIVISDEPPELTNGSVNPVTGEKNFILPNLDENWERNVGQQMYAPMRQSQGGDYKLDPALTEYVQDVGQRSQLSRR